MEMKSYLEMVMDEWFVTRNLKSLMYTRHVHIAIYNILYVLPFSFFRFSDSIREMQQSQSVVGVVRLPLLSWPNQYMEQF